VRAAATVSPRGKQASFASRARASYILVEKGAFQPRTLAGAFYKPVKGEDIIQGSIQALETWRDRLDEAYGDKPGSAVMNATPVASSGTLADIITFARAG
jgi:CRISPR system Cascade subunit CasC